MAEGRSRTSATPIVQSIAIALATVGVGYAAVVAADFRFKIDFRFWIVAFKLMSPTQLLYFLVYLIPFTFLFLAAFRALHGGLAVNGESPVTQYLVNMAAMALGFAILLAIQYVALFTTGAVINPTGNPIVVLNTIIAIQFLPLLMIMGLIATFTFRRTNSYVPGALICGLLVAWYVVAGQATHAPV